MSASYKNLRVWKKADELAFRVYEVTNNFPSKEQFGIISQLRRAALSVPTNIVEGVGRTGRLDTKRFVNIAIGSIFEVEYLLDFSRRLGYVDINEFKAIDGIRQDTGALLWKFYQCL